MGKLTSREVEELGNWKAVGICKVGGDRIKVIAIEGSSIVAQINGSELFRFPLHDAGRKRPYFVTNRGRHYLGEFIRKARRW